MLERLTLPDHLASAYRGPQVVSGWTGRCSSETHLFVPTDKELIRQVLKYASANKLTVIAKGGGFSFGDLFVGAHITLDLTELNRIISWDSDKGVMLVQPGVTIRQVLNQSMQDNWWLTACPGWPDITIGGAVSANVHGKDAFHYGNIGESVTSMKVITDIDAELKVSRSSNSSMFHLTVGGLGLVGIITEVELSLNRVASSFLQTTTQVANNLDNLFEQFDLNLEKNDFVYAWMDMYATQNNIGRGIVFSAKWQETPAQEILEDKHKIGGLADKRSLFKPVSNRLTLSLLRLMLSKIMIRYTNCIYYYSHIFRNWHSRAKTVAYKDYYFLPQITAGIPQNFAPFGFVEFQMLFPLKRIDHAMRDLITLCAQHKTRSFMAGIKRHKADDFDLSFSGDGYSISIDFPSRYYTDESISEFTLALSKLALKFEGKFYLAKDSSFRKPALKSLYKSSLTLKNHRKDTNAIHLFSSQAAKRLID